MKIWVNTIVNNEENFIWFAVMSVIDFVDKVLIYDTGSTDNTVKIIKEIQKIKGDKICFKEVGQADSTKFVKMRQQILDESDCDWLLILDGDEIWWEDSIKTLVQKINKEKDNINGIVVPMIIPVGDLYHFQTSGAGRYELLGKKGHFNLRAINRKIPGLHAAGIYPLESYYDQNNCPIQNKDQVIFLDAPYLHVTHLKRSTKIRLFSKFKYEIGKRFPLNFKYPKVFYNEVPDIVPDPFQRLSGLSLILAKIITPIRQVKRKIGL